MLRKTPHLSYRGGWEPHVRGGGGGSGGASGGRSSAAAAARRDRRAAATGTGGSSGAKDAGVSGKLRKVVNAGGVGASKKRAVVMADSDDSGRRRLECVGSSSGSGPSLIVTSSQMEAGVAPMTAAEAEGRLARRAAQTAPPLGRGPQETEEGGRRSGREGLPELPADWRANGRPLRERPPLVGSKIYIWI